MDAPANKPAPTFDCRVAFAETLIELAKADERIVAVCNDCVGSSNSVGFQKLFPDRLINVGIAEQNMVGVGAGLANGGLIPFVCGAAPFLTGRALEQIKADVAYNGFPVVLCGMSPGMAYGELGPTHHSIEDLSWLRAIDGLAIVVPADPAQTGPRCAGRRNPARHATCASAAQGPGRDPGGSDGLRVRAGRRAAQRRETLTIVATGAMVSPRARSGGRARRTAVLRRASSTSRPSSRSTRRRSSRRRARRARSSRSRRRRSRAASAPRSAETVVRNAPVPMRILGVTGFAPTGTAEFLLDHFGLNPTASSTAALELEGPVRWPARSCSRSTRARARPRRCWSTAAAP